MKNHAKKIPEQRKEKTRQIKTAIAYYLFADSYYMFNYYLFETPQLFYYVFIVFKNNTI